MPLGKQAKTLTRGQIDSVLAIRLAPDTPRETDSSPCCRSSRASAVNRRFKFDPRIASSIMLPEN